MNSRHFYSVEALVGPERLFKALRETKEDTRLREHELEFEFDWLKRRIAISALSAEGVDAARKLFLERITRAGAAPDALLAGKLEEVGGRHVQPFGVLLNPPEAFVELIVQMLMDVGCVGLRLEGRGTGFSFPIGSVARALNFEELVEQFPLPAYVALRDDGRRMDAATKNAGP